MSKYNISTEKMLMMYDVLLLCRKDIEVERWWRIGKAITEPSHDVLVDLPSRLGRSCLVADVKLPGQQMLLRIGTVHLESESKPRSVELRKQQLETILPLLSDDGQVAVLCGDMNMCSSSDENATIAESNYTDAWPVLHPDEPGYTEDSSLNRMKYLMIEKAKTGTYSAPPVRFDRVLLYNGTSSGQGHWDVVSIERLGTAPLLDVPDDSVQLWPSDHIGLCATIAPTAGP